VIETLSNFTVLSADAWFGDTASPAWIVWPIETVSVPTIVHACPSAGR